MTAARDYARMIAANSPFAVQQTKRSVMEGLGMEREAAFDSEQAIGSGVFGHADAREGPLAFVEKRAAVWSDE
jgi:enoyl-CoA hydratase